MQDYKEIIKEITKEVLEIITGKLVKLTIILCIVLCTSFTLILISISGFYFIGYSNYPKEVTDNVGEDKGSIEENILQTPKTTQTPKIIKQ
jgi:hypothetical protein